jgi:hypothetical protein
VTRKRHPPRQAWASAMSKAPRRTSRKLACQPIS